MPDAGHFQNDDAPLNQVSANQISVFGFKHPIEGHIDTTSYFFYATIRSFFVYINYILNKFIS